MITNLFSTFDPSTNIFNWSINWLSSFFILTIIPISFWLIPNNNLILLIKVKKTLFNEFKIILNKNNNFTLIFISLFLIIVLNNFIGLFPYIFVRTRHLTINLTLTLPLWLRLIIFGWINKTKHIFIHLVPQGTPKVLIPFIVCIETIRNIIRPITLSVRLTANIIAGHLLITLLRNIGRKINLFIIPILLIIQLILLTLESAVAIIQSYVFSVLITLYFREIYFTKSFISFSQLQALTYFNFIFYNIILIKNCNNFSIEKL